MKPITIRLWVPESAADFTPADYTRVTTDELTAYMVSIADPDYRPHIQLVTDKELQSIADGNAERAYHATVVDIVDDLKRAVKDGEVTDRDGAIEWIEQTVDGHHDVIYTSYAQDVLRHSRNDGAYFEDFGSEGAISDGGIEWSKLAYCALRADVLEQCGDLDDWFKCSDCNGDVTEDEIRAAVDTENYPVCADCRGDSDEDEDAKA